MADARLSAGDEEWRVVPSCPQIEASSWGRIRRKEHRKAMPHGGMRTYRSDPTFGVDTKASKTASHIYKGYVYRGIGNVKVHRMVCEAFHGSSKNKYFVVIHINEDAFDNRPSNLRWGTQRENLNMPKITEWRNQRIKAGLHGKRPAV